LSLLLSLLVATGAIAEDPSTQAADESVRRGLQQLVDLQNAFAHIAETASPSVVAVLGQRKLSSVNGIDQERSEEFLKRFGDRLVPAIGSGVLISEQGHVLTNEHVVQSVERITIVLHDRHRFKAKVVATDPRSDLAVLRIIDGEEAKLRPAEFGRLAEVRKGHWAIAMGNAFGLAAEGRPAMTVGVVSAIGRVLPAQFDLADRFYGNLIQTSADINPGNSGGPLLNLHGQVIGINTAISSRSGFSEGVGFAIPITPRTLAIVETLRAGRKVEYGFLGVTVRSPTPAESRSVGSPAYVGALVASVEPDTPADKADLRVGDVIVEIDNTAIDDYSHLVRTIGGSPIGRPIEIVLWRNGKRVTTRAELVQRDAKIVRRGPGPVWLDWRGARIMTLTPDRRKQLELPEGTRGVEVISVADGSPAADAGIELGDVIDRLNREPVRSLGDFQKISRGIGAARDVHAHLVKGGEKVVKGKS
jgi:serine protease Do